MENPPTSTATAQKKFYFEWLIPFLFRPRANARQVVQKRPTWLTPMLVISLLIGMRIWFSPQPMIVAPVDPSSQPIPGPKGQLGVYAVSSHRGGGGGGGGGGMIGPSTGGTDGLPQEGATATGTSSVVPLVTALAGFWVGWFLLSVLLYLGLVVSGGSNNFTEALNLVAWTSLPLGLRQIPLLITALAIPTAAANASGLGALVGSAMGPTGYYLSSFLKLVDVYLIWQVVLLILGLGQISTLPVNRRIGISFAVTIVFLVIAAFPGFLSAIFAQLTQPVPGMY